MQCWWSRRKQENMKTTTNERHSLKPLLAVVLTRILSY